MGPFLLFEKKQADLGTPYLYFQRFSRRHIMIGFLTIVLILITITLNRPYRLGDPDNFIPANVVFTPVIAHTQYYDQSLIN